MRFVALLVAALLSASAPAGAVDVHDTRLLAQPAISGEHIAFTYAGDLWVAKRDGTGARRLTSDVGDEQAPAFSPDGNLIAFSAEYDGNIDVFVVSVEGGAPVRLTWHPSPDLVEDFTPDGRAVLFSSRRSSFTGRHRQLFTVPIDGGFPEQLPIPNGLRAEFSPDGSKIAYIPISERFLQWKYYRGGTASRIWIYDRSDHSVVEVPQPEGRCNDTDPTWIGTRLFFRSDRAGELNVFSYDGATEAVSQATTFADFPVNRLNGDGSTLILEQAGYLHTLDPGDTSPQRLRIGVAADLVETRPRWVEGAEWIRSADLSPSGARAVFGYRGEVLTLPAKKGASRNLTSSPGVHERSPVWSPDGQSIAFFSDDGGEARLHIVPQDGLGEPRVVELEGHGFYFDPKFSPDGTKLSYTDNSQSLYVVELGSGEATRVASEPHYRPGLSGPSHAWSPDSRWLAYRVNTDASFGRIWVFDTETSQSHAITDGLSDADEPVFDRGGDFLYFRASTDAGPVKNWFAMSNADVRSTNNLYLVVLREGVESPFKAESDEEVPDDGDSPDEEENEAEEDVRAVGIDFERLSDRIVALPLETAEYTDLAAGESGALFYRRRSSGTGPWDLARFALDEREETVLLADAEGFVISADGKKLLYAMGGDRFGIAVAGQKIDPSASALDVGKLRVRIDPRAEWAQIFDEAWRINRDYFYDPGMHGADWQAVGERYNQFLPDLTTRSDLNRVLRWMSSELAVGHHRNGGGDRRRQADRVPGGLLGVDFEIDQDRYRFAKIYGGLNWNPELRSPLTEPGVAVGEGEYLLAVEGQALDSTTNVYSRFEQTAGQVVRITVGPNADGSDARTIEVVPIADEGGLRNRAWVERNRETVDRLTSGRVAYVYVPNTTTLGHTYFKRYFFPQANREAIIVDERFNGGGQVADYYIDHLRRPFISYWATRYGDDIRTPSAAIFGPKVMIIDETAGSGGDLLPWMFRKLGLGTLIGKRTWGGLVGVLGFPVLMDGGFITAPNLAIWTEDGFVVENVGVPPDVEVEQWPAEVIAGRDPQLEKAIEVALRQLEASPLPRLERPPYPRRADGPSNPQR